MIARPDGFNACRWCKGPVRPPKRSFCGNPECLDQWLRRTNPAHMRRVILDRDKGVCAACGLDTLPYDLEDLRGQLYLADAWWRANERTRRKITPRPRLRADGTPWPASHYARLIPNAVAWHERHKLPLRSPPWEVDHIVEVADGGDWFDLGNLQSLCICCHRQKTIQFNRSRKKILCRPRRRVALQQAGPRNSRATPP